MSPRRKTDFLVAALAATLLLTLLVPGATAIVAPTYGAIVVKPASTSNDLSMVVFDTSISAATTATSSGIGFQDCDVDGIDATDPWYIDIDADGTIDTGEIRITSVPSAECGTSYSAGSLVTSTDGDRGDALTRTGFAVCFIDSVTPAGDTYNPTEILFISHDDTDCTDDLVVNDVYLNTVSGSSFGSRVTTADNDPDGLAFTAAQFEIYDLDNNGVYTVGDGIYVDVTYGAATTTGYASPGDIRMTGHLSESAGSIVEKDDIDVVYALIDLGYSVVRETADAATCSGTTPPSIYLSAGATVAANDIRLTASGSFAAGSVVATGDADVLVATTDITASVKRVDLNDNNNVFDADDFIWYDSNGDDDIDEGETRLSKSGSRSTAACVTASDGDRGLSSDGAIATTNVKYFDTDRSGGYNSGDLVYLDMDDGIANDGGDGYVSVGDIKWSTSTQLSGITYGDPTDSDDMDVTYVLDLFAAAGHTIGVFCYEDESGGASYGAGEPVYLRLTSTTACGTAVDLAPGDVRLTSTSGGLAAGAYVSGGSADNGHSVRAFGVTPSLRFYNIGTDLGTFQTGDVLYLDSDASGKVSVGDVIITGVSTHGTAGEVVASSDTAILNGDLVAFTAGTCATAQNYCIRGFDVDGDRTASVNDVAVWDDGLMIGTTRFVTVGDAYLSGTGGTTSSFSGTGPGSGGGTSAPPPATGTQPNPAFSCTGTIGGDVISVDASSSTDPDGSLTSYSWNWGDGTTAVGAQRTHVYTSPGQYTVMLTVTDNANNAQSLSRTIAIPLVRVDCLPQPDPTQSEDPTESPDPSDPTDASPSPSPSDPDDDPRGTPGPTGAVLLAAALLALGVVARRRR